MGRLSRNWFVLGASGGISLCMKMETYYQKNYTKEQMIEQRQPEVSIPLAYESEIILKDKASLYRDEYFFINLFDKIIYEAKKELGSR